MKYLTFNNGVKTPIFGFGTYRIQPRITEGAVAEALKAGYRLIDTAQAYSNEAEVDNAINKRALNVKTFF